MTPSPSPDRDLLLIHAPFGRDAAILQDLFQRAGLTSAVCSSIEDVCGQVEQDVGAMIIAEEALDQSGVRALTAALEKQEDWSDLPIIILTTGGEPTEAIRERLARLEPLGDLTLLERPLRSQTLISAARSALRARGKQRQIRERERELREAQLRLRAVMDQMPSALFIVEAPSGKLAAHNAEFERILGHPAIPSEDYQGYSGYGAVHADGQPYTAEEYPLARALLCGEVTRQEEMLYRRRDGKVIYLSVSAGPVHDQDRLVAAVCCFNDITAMKESEAERERLVNELARSNEELTQFAHIAAHDLKTPLRTVMNYTQLLERRLKGKIDGETLELMALVQDGTQSMDQLIQGLLRYAQVGQAAIEQSNVQLSAVVAEAVTSLDALISEKHAQVDIGHLPEVPGDSVLLVQLMQNLISNALKYHRSDVTPYIRVAAEKPDGNWTVIVEDNGQGIAHEYQEKIFEPFRRLHGHDIPGSGIGLAVCKKIVERHGGRIWVDSQPNKGSRFFFTLPTAKDRASTSAPL